MHHQPTNQRFDLVDNEFNNFQSDDGSGGGLNLWASFPTFLSIVTINEFEGFISNVFDNCND